MAEVEVDLRDRTRTLGAAAGDRLGGRAVGAAAAQLALARVRRGRRVGLLTDAFAARRAAARHRCAALRPGRDRHDRRRRDPLQPDRRGWTTLELLPEAPEIRWLSAEQSQQLADRRRRGGAQDLPARHAGRASRGRDEPLSDRARLSPIRAPLLGEVVRVDEDGDAAHAASSQGFIRNQGDGWTWTLDYLEPRRGRGGRRPARTAERRLRRLPRLRRGASAGGSASCTRCWRAHRRSGLRARTGDGGGSRRLDRAGALAQLDAALDVLSRRGATWQRTTPALAARAGRAKRHALHDAVRRPGRGPATVR